MPLSTAEEAAWAATLALKRGSKTLPPALQTSLVAFFKANDLGLAEYWPVDVKDVDWQDQWKDFATGAGLTADWQRNMLVRWIENKSGAATPISHRSAAVVKILEDGGIMVPAGVAAQLDAAMVSSSAGDMQTQATSCVFVALLYMGGQLPGEMEEFTEWWTAQKAALQSADDSVCVRRWARYAKMHTQSTAVTLERALMDNTDGKWEMYQAMLMRAFMAHDLALGGTTGGWACE